MKLAPSYARRHDDVPDWLRNRLSLPVRGAVHHQFYVPKELENVAFSFIQAELASGAEMSKT
eukprot:7795774-Karenia_brevis.AAC.1